MDRAIRTLDFLTWSTPRELVVDSPHEPRQTLTPFAAGALPTAKVAIRGTDLYCSSRAKAAQTVPNASTPMLLGSHRHQHLLALQQHRTEVGSLLALFREVGPEQAVHVGLSWSILAPFGYVSYLAALYSASVHNDAIAQRQRNHAYFEQAFASVTQVTSVLELVERIEQAQEDVQHGRPVPEDALWRNIILLLTQWERQKATWTTPGQRALAELRGALMSSSTDAGADLLLEVWRQAQTPCRQPRPVSGPGPSHADRPAEDASAAPRQALKMLVAGELERTYRAIRWK